MRPSRPIGGDGTSARVRGAADGLDLAWPAQGYDSNWMTDPLRATYRYTFLERRDWALKVGVTARLGDWDSVRVPAAGIDRTRFGSLPLVHLAGEGRLARDWLLSVDADGWQLDAEIAEYLFGRI